MRRVCCRRVSHRWSSRVFRGRSREILSFSVKTQELEVVAMKMDSPGCRLRCRFSSHLAYYINQLINMIIMKEKRMTHLMIDQLAVH